MTIHDSRDSNPYKLEYNLLEKTSYKIFQNFRTMFEPFLLHILGKVPGGRQEEDSLSKIPSLDKFPRTCSTNKVLTNKANSYTLLDLWVVTSLFSTM